MELSNHNNTELSHRADGQRPIGTSSPIPSINPSQVLTQSVPAPQFNPRTYPVPVYTPVISIPVVTQVPATPVSTVSAPAPAPVDNSSSAKEGDTSVTSSGAASKTIFGMQPLTASIWGLAIVVGLVYGYKHRADIKKLFA